MQQFQYRSIVNINKAPEYVIHEAYKAAEPHKDYIRSKLLSSFFLQT